MRTMSPWLALGLLSFPLAAQETAPESAPQRSLMFWLIDTCRADRLSVYGHERPTTPFLERLAAQGVTFERCYSQAPWTKPSMTSILTSLYPSRHGSTQMFVPTESAFTTFPEVLREAGWYTSGFSANPMMGSFTNLHQGFAEFKDSWQMIQGQSPLDYASGSASKILPFAVDWLEANDRWPFLLYMHSMDPHEQYAPAPEYVGDFADPSHDAQFRADWDKLMAIHGDIVNTCTRETFATAGVEIAPFIDYASRLYDADVRANDAAIETLWEFLNRDEFIVVVTADHGTEFFDHGATSLGHSLYQEMIHVPLIFWAPGLIPEGVRFTQPVRSIDIYPTLLDLLGLEMPAGLAGQSLVPWLKKGQPTEARLVYSDHVEETSAQDFGAVEDAPSTGEAFSVIRWPWKLILHQKPRLGMTVPRHELFNLALDPTEQKNLAGSNAELVAELEELVLAHVAAGGAVAVPQAAEIELDPEVRKALEALGYVGGEDD